MSMESPLQLCSKAISSPYNPNNHHINANQTPPFQIPNKQSAKNIKVRVNLAHSASTRMMAVAYTSLATYETTPIYKSRLVAQMCCWFTAKTKYSTPEFKFGIQHMIMESCVEANRAFSPANASDLNLVF